MHRMDFRYGRLLWNFWADVYYVPATIWTKIENTFNKKVSKSNVFFSYAKATWTYEQNQNMQTGLSRLSASDISIEHPQ